MNGSRKAYHGLLKETIRLQKRVALQKCVDNVFGKQALCLVSNTRGAVKDAAEQRERSMVLFAKMIAENIETMRQLEALFEKADEAEMQAFVDSLKARMGK